MEFISLITTGILLVTILFGFLHKRFNRVNGALLLTGVLLLVTASMLFDWSTEFKSISVNGHLSSLSIIFLLPIVYIGFLECKKHETVINLPILAGWSALSVTVLASSTYFLETQLMPWVYALAVLKTFATMAYYTILWKEDSSRYTNREANSLIYNGPLFILAVLIAGFSISIIGSFPLFAYGFLMLLGVFMAWSILMHPLHSLNLDPVLKKLSNESAEPVQKISAKNILHYMRQHKPWHNPELSLGQLAIQTNTPVDALEYIIKEVLKTDWWYFINTYRIEESQQLLREPNHNQLAMVEIAQRVGFSNLRDFNNAFIKHSGITASHFREKHHQATGVASIQPQEMKLYPRTA